jgi:hypothetical protein
MKLKLPNNLIAGLVAGCIVGVAAGFADPADTKAFYGAAVQVVPVFLVALALERTLAEILGTETSVLSEETARLDREWTPPSSMTRAYHEVGLKLRDREPVVLVGDTIHDMREQLEDQTLLAVARGLVDEDNATGDRLEELIITLGTLATREYAVGSSVGSSVEVTPEQLLTEWDKLNEALWNEARRRAADEVRFTVSTAYRERRDRQRMSVVVSVVTLAVAETLAFIGLLSPRGPYAGLFIATAAAVAASFVAVTVDAVINLLAPDVDVQSAGLSWPTAPGSRSHWDDL